MALATECSKNEDLAEKLSKLSVRNTSKKLRRRDNKYKTQIEILQEDNMSQSKELTKLEKCLEHSQHASERNHAARCHTVLQSRLQIWLMKEKNHCLEQREILKQLNVYTWKIGTHAAYRSRVAIRLLIDHDR